MLAWLWACAPAPEGAPAPSTPPPDRSLAVRVAPSPELPAVATLSWEGPAGEATLWTAPDGSDAWEAHAAATVAEGASALPVALLPVAHVWRWRVTVDADDGATWESPPGEVYLPPAPDVALTATIQPGAAFSSGYWVGHQYAPDVALVLDAHGSVVWWAPPSTDGGRVLRVRPSLDGRSVLVLEDHPDPALRRIVRFDLDGQRRLVTAAPDASHDFQEGDGTFTYVAHLLSDTERMPHARLPTASDVLRTVPEGSATGDDAVDGFDFFDDYPYEPWFPCKHAGYDRFVDDASEWTHTNSLIRSPRGGWLLVPRYLDAIVQVTADGAFGWQAGGRHATLTAEGGPLFRHGHASDAWDAPDGLHLLMFDNGSHGPPPVVSRAVELVLSPPPEGDGTMRAVWSLSDPAQRMTTFLGDAQRLPGGDTLVTWTGSDRRGGVLAEYTPAGDEVWRVEAQATLGRGRWVPALSP
ncbi:MAG: aryl-sulfate sulfotransferase [Myxococcota bacterium]